MLQLLHEILLIWVSLREFADMRELNGNSKDEKWCEEYFTVVINDAMTKACIIMHKIDI